MAPAQDSGRSGRLTASQHLIWTGQRLSPGSPLYNMAIAVSIEGPLDPGVFATAFQRLVRHHDALRTVIVDTGGAAIRHVLPEDAAPQLPIIAAPVSNDDLRATLHASVARPFALDRLLFAGALYATGPDRWLFFLNQHHLVTDAWSTGALYRQLGALYRDLLEGRDETRPSGSPFQAFVDYEEAERRSHRYEKAARFWRESSPAAHPRLRFYGRSGGGGGRTGRFRRMLDRDRTARLRARASEGVAALTTHQWLLHVFAGLLAAWVHRVADVPHVSIGAPHHNRSRSEFRETLGLFMELLPVRMAIDEGDTLAALVRKASLASFDTMRHAVPGCSLLPETRGFEVVLNVITASLGDFAGLPATTEWIHSGFGDPAHALRLQVYDFGGTGELTLDFDLADDVFDGFAARWAVDHFMRLLDAWLADPDVPVAAVTLTTWDEAASFMPAVTLVQPDPRLTVAGMFRRQATASPDAPAVIDGSRVHTYAALATMVDAVRSRLRIAGARPGAVVATCLEASAGLVAAWLGTLEAGAAFLPLDPRHPFGRLSQMVRDASAVLVVVDAGGGQDARRWGIPALAIDGLTEPSENPGSDFSPTPRGAALVGPGVDESLPGGLAYILYTSGSTGAPKGVEVTHAALTDYVTWAARTYCRGEKLGFALFTSPAFDLTLTSVLVPLVSGGSVVVYRQASIDDFVVRRIFEDDRVHLVKLTPSHLALIRDLPLERSRVRRLIVGGEDLKTGVAADISRAFGRPVEIFNEYGPTEATVGCAVHLYESRTDTAVSVPIGVPADNTAIYVLDAYDRPVPRGVSGEICIAGVRVARGYRNRPGETAARFTRDPRRPEVGMYRSGDRGRWSADGYLEFLGRRDAQVKVRGVRVELGEVEAALAAHPAIEDAVVVLADATSRQGGRCRLCGLEARHPEARLDAAEVCAVCRSFERQRDAVSRYFGTMQDLRGILAEAKASARGRYDALMLYSGGKDSTFALCSLVELGVRPLVFLLDNGYISEGAKENVRRVVAMLDLDLHVASTPAMATIFADSLRRYSNVCNGCFKTIYTLATALAVNRGIPMIVTGLSRGQIFETRLAEVYRRGIVEPEDVDRTVAEARKAYHRMDDAVSRTLECSVFATDDVFERVRFVDFYRYCDTSLDEMLDYLAVRTPWLRPSDTGRSTNCLINEVGIAVHQAERGFHNYALPYSWDVRLGHKHRDAAIEELDDPIDGARVERVLREVGYRPRPRRAVAPALAAYFVSRHGVAAGDLRRFLEERLPAEAVPLSFVRLEAPPLTPNGKIDRRALASVAPARTLPETEYVAPRNSVETTLARLWSAALGRERIGVDDNFFELGGDSIQCIQIVADARAEGLTFTARDLFSQPTIARLARRVREATGSAVRITAADATAAEMAELLHEFGDERP